MILLPSTTIQSAIIFCTVILATPCVQKSLHEILSASGSNVFSTVGQTTEDPDSAVGGFRDGFFQVNYEQSGGGKVMVKGVVRTGFV